MISVTNIRDMLADNQEDLVKIYIQTYSCEVEKDGVRKVLTAMLNRSNIIVQFSITAPFFRIKQHIFVMDNRLI
jgi:hypothetical protein